MKKIIKIKTILAILILLVASAKAQSFEGRLYKVIYSPENAHEVYIEYYLFYGDKFEKYTYNLEYRGTCKTYFEQIDNTLFTNLNSIEKKLNMKGKYVFSFRQNESTKCISLKGELLSIVCEDSDTTKYLKSVNLKSIDIIRPESIDIKIISRNW